MLKKTIPFIFISAIFLSACTNNTNDALPRNDETPMEDIDEREQDWAPRTEDERRGGTDLDGIDTNEDGNGGIMNNENGDRNDGIMNNENGDRNDPLLDREEERDLNNGNTP